LGRDRDTRTIEADRDRQYAFLVSGILPPILGHAQEMPATIGDSDGTPDDPPVCARRRPEGGVRLRASRVSGSVTARERGAPDARPEVSAFRDAMIRPRPRISPAPPATRSWSRRKWIYPAHGQDGFPLLNSDVRRPVPDRIPAAGRRAKGARRRVRV